MNLLMGAFKKLTVLSFLFFISISSAHADHLRTLCQEMIDKSADPKVGSYTVATIFWEEVYPEAVKRVELELRSEIDQYFNSGAGKSISSKKMSNVDKKKYYLSTIDSVDNFGRNLLSSLGKLNLKSSEIDSVDICTDYTRFYYRFHLHALQIPIAARLSDTEKRTLNSKLISFSGLLNKLVNVPGLKKVVKDIVKHID